MIRKYIHLVHEVSHNHQPAMKYPCPVSAYHVVTLSKKGFDAAECSHVLVSLLLWISIIIGKAAARYVELRIFLVVRDVYEAICY